MGCGPVGGAYVAQMSEPGGANSLESDECLIESVLLGDVSRFAVLVQRYNRSLYRVARSIVGDEHEAEDVVQQAHVSAFMHLHEFEGRSKFSTWLARIARHEALSRLRQRGRLVTLTNEGMRGAPSAPSIDTPEERLSRSELARVIESAIERLPQHHRLAFVLRHVDGLGTAEAAECLGVSEANLRVLVHRACRLLRAYIVEQAQIVADDVFSFGGERCARVTQYVLLAVSARTYGAGAARQPRMAKTTTC